MDVLQSILKDQFVRELPNQVIPKYFYHGIVYFMWFQVPQKILNVVKNEEMKAYMEGMKIGFSGKDLYGFLKKNDDH